MSENRSADSWVDDVLAKYGELLDVDEVAEVLGIDVQQVRRRLRLGNPAKRLPGVKIAGGHGGQWRTAKAELRQYLLDGHNRSTAGRPAHHDDK